MPEQSSPLSSNSSASTRNPKFIAGFFYSSSSLSSSSLRGPNLLSWFVIFAVAVETLHHRLDLESVSASPIPPSRRSTSGVPTRSSSRGADADLDNPLQAMGELRAAVFDRLRRASAILKERRRPGKGGVLNAARRRFGLADS